MGVYKIGGTVICSYSSVSERGQNEIYIFKCEANDMGVTESMIRSTKDNRKLRGEIRRMSDRGEEYAYECSKPLKFKSTMSKEELQRHKAKWKARKRQAQIKIGVMLLSMVGILLFFGFWIAS